MRILTTSVALTAASSPIGQIRADFAYPVMKQDGDQTQFFGLSSGTRF